MYNIENMPKHSIQVGKTTFSCVGTQPEQRRIIVEGVIFTSLQKLTKSFPELIHSPSALAQCVNFMFTGDTFRVITNPIKFKNTYFQNSDDVDLSSARPPHFEGNMFIFYVWNEVNDKPYKATCTYPFTDSPSDAIYELL